MPAAHRSVTVIDPRFRFDVRPKPGCFGKRQFASPAAIIAHHRHLERHHARPSQPLQTYHCPVCHFFHEGSS